MKTDVIQLTKQLIEIPSYKDGKLFESSIGNFLCEYIKKNLPYLQVEKQLVEKNRYNILLRDTSSTKLLIVDHIDTVLPTPAWKTDPIQPIEKMGKLYGLGSSDTKGSIAACLTALTQLSSTRGLAILLYVDEEYDFKGMKKFVNSSLAKKIRPQYVLSIDGDNLQIGRGCRGITEFQLILQGTTGHSARKIGNNVNAQFIKIIASLEKWLDQYQSPFLGMPTLNVARINSGFLKGKTDGQIIFGEEGNRIPDYLEAIIEIRTSSDLLTFKSVEAFLKKEITNRNLKITKLKERFNLPSYETPKEAVESFQLLPNVSPTFLDPGNFGFLDVSLLQQRYPKATVFSLGAGTPNQGHAPNEYVEMSNLTNATQTYKALIQKLCGKGVKISTGPMMQQAICIQRRHSF